jgi:hypothetical protein
MRWNQGRAEVDAMIASGEIERVHPGRGAADELLGKAREHLNSVGAIIDSDPDEAYLLVYDAARKTLAAVLQNEGLRATGRGGHLAVYQPVRAQLDPPMGRAMQPFDRMRRRRNAIEYSATSQAPVTAEEIREDAAKAQAVVDAMHQVLDSMSPF